MYFEYGEKETACLMSKDARLAAVIKQIGHIYREVDELQSFGMTFRKAEYIKSFSLKVVNGEFDLGAVSRMPDKDAISALSSIKGIGVRASAL